MKKKYDVIIVGTGAAGLYAALNFPSDISVLLVSKRELDLSNSALAQGGVACVLDTIHDSYKLHINDTLIAGKYKNKLSAVEKLVRETVVKPRASKERERSERIDRILTGRGG